MGNLGKLEETDGRGLGWGLLGGLLEEKAGHSPRLGHKVLPGFPPHRDLFDQFVELI